MARMARPADRAKASPSPQRREAENSAGLSILNL
jgi:hypothetical protein